MEHAVHDRSIWRQMNFVKFWSATVLSALGDSALFVLIAWFILDVTSSQAALGNTLMILTLPRLFFMLLGGVLADRISRKKILIASVLIRGVLLILLALFLGGFHGGDVLWLVYPVAFLFGVVDAFFWPARGSSLPFVVKAHHLSQANSVVETSQQLSMVFGTVLASQLFHLSSYSWMFGAVSVFFLLSMFLLFFLRMNEQPDEMLNAETPEPTPSGKKSALGEVWEGIRYVWSFRVLTLILFILLFANVLIMGPLNIGLPSLVKELGWDGKTFGYFEAAIGGGAICGGILTALLKGFRGRLRIMSLFLVIMGLSFAAAGMMETFAFGFGVLFVTGMMFGMTNIPIMTYFQTVSEPHMLGRVMSLQSLMSMGLNPVSFALTSLLLEGGLVTSSATFYVGGIGVALIGPITLYFKEFRHMEKHPRWVAAGQKHPVGASPSRDEQAVTTST
jgi:MFS family permease